MKFVLYALVGCAATLVHYAVLIALVELASVGAALAAFIGALIGACTGFMLNYKLTFSNTQVPVQHALTRFMVTAAAGAVASSAIVWACVHLIGWHYLLAQATATVLLLLITYQINRRWSFVA